VIYNVGDYFPIGISITRRTYHRAWIVAASMVVSLIANYVLIPPFGMIGAGIATFVGYAFYCGLLLFVSDSIYPIGYQIVRNLALWAWGGLVIAGVYSFQSLELSWEQVIWKGLIALVTMALPLLFSVVTIQDLQSVSRTLRKYWTRINVPGRLEGLLATDE